MGWDEGVGEQVSVAIVAAQPVVRERQVERSVALWPRYVDIRVFVRTCETGESKSSGEPYVEHIGELLNSRRATGRNSAADVGGKTIKIVQTDEAE